MRLLLNKNEKCLVGGKRIRVRKVESKLLHMILTALPLRGRLGLRSLNSAEQTQHSTKTLVPFFDLTGSFEVAAEKDRMNSTATAIRSAAEGDCRTRSMPSGNVTRWHAGSQTVHRYQG